MKNLTPLLLFIAKRQHRDKHGWLKIVEAFIAVVMVMSALLIVLDRQSIYVEQEEQREFTQTQGFIMDQIRNDQDIKTIIVGAGDDDANAEDKLREAMYLYVPNNFNYSVRICSLEQVCSQNFYVPYEVFSNEVIIASNLTTYNPRVAKLFFWEGPFAEDVPCFNDCTLSGKIQCWNEFKYQTCGEYDNDNCLDWSQPVDCDNNWACEQLEPGKGICVPPTAVVEFRFENLEYKWESPFHTYYHDRVFKETNGVSVHFTSYKLCYQSTGQCEEGSVDYTINGEFINPSRKLNTPSSSDKFTLTYFGIDDYDHLIESKTALCVQESFSENC